MSSRPRSRLLILTSWYPNAASPVSGIFIRDQAEILAKDFDVLVAFLKPTAGRSLPLDLLRPRQAIVADGPVRLSAGRYHAMPNTARPFITWLAYRECRRRMDAALRQWGGAPDIIHAHVAIPAGLVAVRLGKELDVPVVLTEHTGPFSALIPRQGARAPVEEALIGANAVLAVSPALASAMQSEFPALRPHVLGNVVRTDFFTPGIRRSAKRFRFVALALMQPNKGIDVLLRAARSLVDSGDADFEIVIGGDGPERAGLERMARDYGLHACVRFLGLLDRSGVRTLLQDADAFVLPSLGETFGVAVAEAMACGTPVVATRCGGPEFVVGPEDGILVAPGDPHALGQGMRAVREGIRAWSRHAIRESIEKRFGPAAFRSALLEIYASLRGRGARA